MNFENNIVCDTDFYKIARHLTTRRGTTNLYSYQEPRIGGEHKEISVFGMQMNLIDHFVGQVVTKEKIEKAKKKIIAWGGYSEYFNDNMWNTVLNKYNGRLPIRIRALKEGTVVPIGTPTFTIEALDECIVPFIPQAETLLSHSWYTSTLSTNAMYMKRLIMDALSQTGCDSELAEWMLIFFGYRSATCQEQAKRGDMANLIHFIGSDTTVADRGIDFYYGYSQPSRLKSVFATEHSDAQLFGRGEGEYEYIKHMLTVAPDSAIVSIVTDTYDGINFVDNVATRKDVKEMILKRAGKTVFRMDSGNMVEVMNRSLNSLSNSFGYDFNKSHFKTLNPKIGTLCSNKVDRNTIPELYSSIKSNGYAASNMLVGSGNGTMQDFSRDTDRYAVKGSWALVNGEEVNLIKDPATDSFKKSKQGRLKVHQTGKSFITFSSADMPRHLFDSYTDAMDTVFEMGELTRKQDYDDVIRIAKSYL